MTTTATIDAKNVLTVVTDQAFGSGSIVVGIDTTPFVFSRNQILISGATITPLTNDKGAPKTTATFQVS